MQAVALLAEMPSRRVRPDVVCFGAAIAALAEVAGTQNRSSWGRKSAAEQGRRGDGEGEGEGEVVWRFWLVLGVLLRQGYLCYCSAYPFTLLRYSGVLKYLLLFSETTGQLPSSRHAAAVERSCGFSGPTVYLAHRLAFLGCG